MFQPSRDKEGFEAIYGQQSRLSAVWTIDEICQEYRLGRAVAYSVVNRAGFPNPLGNQHRNRSWLAEDVKTYFREISTTPRSGLLLSKIDIQNQPSSIRLKD